ncbi:MAG: ribonuclease III [Legionellales bacterium]|nr:ribonuclease III [Legionellales bacterium]
MAVRKSHTKLYAKLGYSFQDEKLLIAALTHRSVPQNNNERLEFLGDSIVNFIAAELVYKQFRLADEGELSRLRTMLVRGETLAMLARTLGIGEYLYLGSGEVRSGGAHRESILADALEAIIAAMYLDGGLEVCKKALAEWFAPMLIQLLAHKADKDPKTQLQEYLQSKLIALPHYQVTEIGGKAHAQLFTVECMIPEISQVAIGKGTSRRRAEQQSAELMLIQLTQGKQRE